MEMVLTYLHTRSPNLSLSITILRNSNNKRTVQSILLVVKLLGLVEMKSGLVNASFSLPEWQAVKMIFFAPCFIVTPCRCFASWY